MGCSLLQRILCFPGCAEATLVAAGISFTQNWTFAKPLSQISTWERSIETHVHYNFP